MLSCVADQNGNHVIQKIIERVPSHRARFVFEARPVPFSHAASSRAAHACRQAGSVHACFSVDQRPATICTAFLFRARHCF